MADVKTKPTNADAMKFLASIKDQRKRADSLKIVEMMQRVTGRNPVMWGESIVGFDQYMIRNLKGKVNVWPLIAFSPRVQNLALYIMHGQERYGGLLQILGKHTTSKTCLYIKRFADVDPDVLRRILEISCQAAKKEFSQ